MCIDISGLMTKTTTILSTKIPHWIQRQNIHNFGTKSVERLLFLLLLLLSSFSVFICFPFRFNRNQKARHTQHTRDEKTRKKRKTERNIATNDLWIRSSWVVSFNRFNVDYKMKKKLLETSIHLSSFIEFCNSIVDGWIIAVFNCADK